MRKVKIYKLVSICSRRDSLFEFIYIQPAYNIRSAFRLMKERLKSYYGFRFVEFRYWSDVASPDVLHTKIY